MTEKYWHLVEASGRSHGVWTADTAEDALFRLAEAGDDFDEDGLEAREVEGWAAFCADGGVRCYRPGPSVVALADEAAVVHCDCCQQPRLTLRTDVAGLAAVRDALRTRGVAAALEQTGGMCVALNLGERGVVVSEGEEGEFTVCPAWGTPADLEGTGPFVELRGVEAVVAHFAGVRS